MEPEPQKGYTVVTQDRPKERVDPFERFFAKGKPKSSIATFLS